MRPAWSTVKLVMYRNFDRMPEPRAGSLLPIEAHQTREASLVAPKCAVPGQLAARYWARGHLSRSPVNVAWRDINAGRNHVAKNVGKFARTSSCPFGRRTRTFL